MDWLCLGHATWLAEAGGLRLLFDPLLGPAHHGGVFEVVPRRTLVAEALRPDFILVSHRHPDHFDVPSLRRLLALDPEVVVVTPDPLVAWACEQLGARSVRLVGPGHRVALDGVALVTTPSLAPDEWGAMVATADGVVWNQVDTVLTDATHVRRVVATCLNALASDRLASSDATTDYLQTNHLQTDDAAGRLTLALVRWQPLLEVAAQLGRRTGFPYREYAALLDAVVATGARAVVPSAAGEAHTRPWTTMNQRVYPVGEHRFLRDLAAAAPGIRGLPCRLGGRYRVRAGEVTFTPDVAAGLLVAHDPADPRNYHPLELEPVRDPGLGDVAESTLRADVDAWIRGPLVRGLARACAGGPSLRLALEVRFAATVAAYTLITDGPNVRVERGLDDDWDALNVVAGSLLWEVLQARRHWGDVLLAGALRACTRAYHVDTAGLQPLALAEVFLYHGLSYDDSVRRAVERSVAAPGR